MENSYGKRATIIVLAMLAVGWVCGCASRQAGLMAYKAQAELAVYVGNANAKVKQAEDARLELELRLLQEDVKEIMELKLADPDRASKEIIARVKSHIDARDTRLKIWDTANLSASNVGRLLNAIGEYNSTGVQPSDIIGALNSIPTPIQPPPPTIPELEPINVE